MDRVTLSNLSLALLLLTGLPATASDIRQLKSMSLEDLANTEVTSASNRSTRLEDTAAAAFVITSEDIRRSGATNLPDLLRLVPGVNVARISSNEWAVSIRGFNDQFANKLQVLIDGRSIYTPLFSGVFWDEQSLLVQDIERIEVIRGPGGATWGANAVNGVINIITRHTATTKDTLVSSVVGSRQYELAGRTGFPLGNNTYGRIFGKGFYQRPLPANEPPTRDDSLWKGGLIGFRTDTDTPDTSLMVAGHFFTEHIENRQPTTIHLATAWEKNRTGSIHTLKGYLHHFDIGNWDTGGIQATGNSTVADISYHWQMDTAARHKPTAGLNYRLVHTYANPTYPTQFMDNDAYHQVFGGFIQDDLTILNNLILSAGIKLEHNDFTGFEYQPSARLRWSHTSFGTFWLATSRAVRTPSIIEDGGSMQGTLPASAATSYLPVTMQTSGSQQLKAETVLSYEAGYRKNISSNLGFDLAAFINYYDNLRTLDFGPLVPQFTPPSPFPTSFYTEVTAGNAMRARTHGIELTADYRPVDAVRLQASYSWLEVQIREKAGNADPNSLDEERKSPRHQAGLASYINLTDQVELDLQFRYVGALPALAVKEYLTCDARIAWLATPGLELSLVGKNLFSAKHREFGMQDVASSTTYRVPREAYIIMNWYF